MEDATPAANTPGSPALAGQYIQFEDDTYAIIEESVVIGGNHIENIEFNLVDYGGLINLLAMEDGVRVLNEDGSLEPWSIPNKSKLMGDLETDLGELESRLQEVENWLLEYAEMEF